MKSLVFDGVDILPPFTCNLLKGLVDPIPTLPPLVMRTFSVGEFVAAAVLNTKEAGELLQASLTALIDA
jgi:hypothetical protein